MRIEPLFLAIGLALGAQAHAADTGGASPYDSNPACMDRTTDASTGNCVEQTEGRPRHKYPPPGPAAAQQGTTAPASTSTAAPAPGSNASLRKAAPAAGSK